MRRAMAVLMTVCLGILMLSCTQDTVSEPASSADMEPSDTVQHTYQFDQAVSGMSPEKDSYYFVFVSKVVHPYYDQIQRGVESAAADYAAMGVEIEWDWDSPAQVDPVDQISRLEAAAAKDPDAIGVVVSDPNVVDPVISEIMNQGIPVVTLSEDSYADYRSAFVGRSDFYQEGIEIAEALAEKINYRGKVGLLVGAVTSVAHYERADGIRTALGKYPDIEIVSEQADNDNLESALTLTEQMLSAYPDLDAIISADGSAHAGAAQAVRDAGRSGDVTIVGFDAIPETIAGIEDGTIYASLAANCYQMGRWVVQVMVDLADQRLTGVIDDISVDEYLLTSDNLTQYRDVVG